MNTRGVITVVNSRASYLSLAIDLALSVKRHSRVSVALVIDPKIKDDISDSQIEIFDHVIPLPKDVGARNLAKLATAKFSPFDCTLYIDADCITVSDISRVFEAIEQSEEGYLLQGEFVSPADHRSHHGLDSSELCRQFNLDRYMKCNSGIMGFTKEAGLRVQNAAKDALPYFQENRHKYVGRAWQNGGVSDEILFGVTASQSRVGIFPQPFPMSWGLHYLKPKQNSSAILHAIGRPSASALVYFLREVTETRRHYKLSPYATIPSWLRKIGLCLVPRKKASRSQD